MLRNIVKLHVIELSRRGVFKTLAAYAVTSWVLIEVASAIESYEQAMSVDPLNTSVYSSLGPLQLLD